MIQFSNVSKRYPSGTTALSNVSFQLAGGEMAFLTGHSGAGKSTLLKLITLEERTTQGQVVIANTPVNRIRESRIPYLRQSMGIIAQSPLLLNDRRVYDNVALSLIIAGIQQLEIGKRVRAALDKVGLLDKERSYPQALSTGEQQRVGIARAVVNRPKILLADEPTGNLDPALSSEIMKLFQQFSDVGVTVLIATHDLALVNDMQHRLLTLEHGRMTVGGEDV